MSGGGEKKGAPAFNFNFQGLAGLGALAAGSEGKFDFNQPGLMGALEQKLGKLMGKPSGYLEKLPASIQKRINGLRTLHNKYLDNEKSFNEELAALRKKYDALSRPLFERRTKIVIGAEEPSEEEVAEGEKIKKEKEEEEKKEEAEEIKEGEDKKEEKKEEKKEDEAPLYPEDTKGIPEFWLQAIRNNPTLSQLLTGEQDEEALKFLTDINWKPVEGEEESFTLEFHFSENPFFENKALVKTWHLTIEPGVEDPVFDRLECTPIQWKEGKNLTVKIVKKKVQQKKKRGGRKGRGGGGGKVTKTIEVEEPCETFFRFFCPPPAPTGEEEADEEEESDPQEEYEAIMSDDLELGYRFKEQLIPRALAFYTGEGISFEDYEGLDFEDEDEEDEEEEEEIRGKGGKRNTASLQRDFLNREEYVEDEDEDYDPSKDTEKPAECKQQ